jgi:eukaryotic-like serine/threonine-protein kinase
MGEVYRARDPRLGRDVALKIVASAGERDADRLRRFEQEARAVAALNHPHILAVHDVGSENGVAYVVFELLDGQTLRERLAHGPIPPRKAVEYGLQIGRGLAAAHSRGVVHRDLKPENVFLTSDGQIKILDFGLAKLTDVPEGELIEAATLTATDPGLAVGTAGYMSPEQARGKKADSRSDVFALGAILYELLSGHPAFGGDTRADRLSAVLHHDPPEIASLTREPVSPGLERVIRRCLEKDPEERFQTARDVAFALDALGGSSAREAVPEVPQPKIGRALRAAILALALMVAATVGLLAGKSMFERRALAIRQLTYNRGTVTGARFTTDERTVVYSASWDGKPNDIFLTRLDGPESRSLGLPPAKLLSVSARGELAILLTKPGEVGDPFLGTLARVALAGGVPRPVLEDVEDADWSPDGQELAVVRILDGERQLEYPLGKVLVRPLPCCPSAHGLRVSPRGDKVALISSAAITIVDRSGGRRSFPIPARTPVGLAWVPRGDAVWVTSAEAELDRFILQVGLDGSRREILHGLGPYILHDVSKAGAALLHHGFERTAIRAKPRGDTEREVTGLKNSWAVDISHDGLQIVIEEAANDGIYLYPVHGGEAVLLTHVLPSWRVRGARLSPDGKWLLGGSMRAENAAELIPTGAGESRKLPFGKWEGLAFGSFLDAGHIYWDAYEPGGPSRRGFVQDIDTGAIRPVTPVGVSPVWSPVVEGAVLGRRADGMLVWCPLAGGEPRPTAARIPSGAFPLQTTPDGKWTFVNTGGLPMRIDRIDLMTGRQEVWKKLGPPDLAGVVYMSPWVPMTPDGEAYAYTYLRVFQDLYLVEGLR